MYEYISGTLHAKSMQNAVVDVNGIGFIAEIPLSTFEQLPEPGTAATIYTHFHVREDIQKLYGFATENERALFRLLITVNKIGPKVAVAILSGMTVGDFVTCISTGNSARLSKVPGIGATTAKRLVVELKDKVKALGISGSGSGIVQESVLRVSGSDDDAFAALVALGYSENQVTKALARVAETVEPDTFAEERIRRALQVI